VTESKSSKLVEWALMVAVGVPILGLLMGAIYSYPAFQLCKGREPWLTGALAAGLSVTVLGIGTLAGVPTLYLAGAWIVSLLLLFVARRLHGSLDGNLERFGKVHATALLMTLGLSMAYGT
jgi:hypothetical protein